MNEPQKVEKRRLTIKFDSYRIHSAIRRIMKSRNVPQDKRGYDLLRGTIFGVVDHPEYTVEQSLCRALEMSSIPGCPDNVQDGYAQIMDCLEPRMSEKDFYNDHGELRDICEIVNSYIYEFANCLYKDYCYERAVVLLGREGYDVTSIAGMMLKNMVFKKLVAPESTKECMYEYAFRKTYLKYPKQNENLEEIITKEMGKILPNGILPYDLAESLAERIYEED